MRHSIRNKVLVIFILELVAVLLVSGFISYRVQYSEEISDVELRCRSAAAAVESVIGEAELETLKKNEDTDLQYRTEELMTAVMKGFSLDRLYLYYVNERMIRIYLVTLTNEESQVFVAATHGLGSVNPSSSLVDQEENALEGRESEQVVLLRTSQNVRYASWIRPYKNADGDVLAVIGADIGFSLQSSEIWRHFFLTFLPLAAILILASVIVFILLRKRVIRPIQKISGRMDQFDPKQQEEPLNIRSKDEIGLIAGSYEKMSADIHRYIDSIETLTAEREKEKAALEIARKIQYGMVPASFEDRRGSLSISAFMQPAKEVGGDFYDAFLKDDGRYVALIGDVSGKGIAGALFMAVVKTMLRDRLKAGMDPASALNLVNDELVRENPEGMFVTVFCLEADPATGETIYANAGHNPPLLFGGGDCAFLEVDPGIALGLFEDSGIENRTVSLKDRGILLYTDGITEAVNTKRQFFGSGRLKDLFAGGVLTGAEAVERVKEAVSAFAEGAEPFDDETLAALFFENGGNELELPTSLEAFDRVKKVLSDALKESPNRKQVILAAEEAFANIVNHSGATKIRFSASSDADELTVVFRDDGVRFDPFKEREPREFEDCDRGGMGIGLIRSAAKDASWQYGDSGNELTLKFTI